MHKLHNNNCDGSHCASSAGEVRSLPTGGGSNAILCHNCYLHEIRWRKGRNTELEPSAQFALPKWNELTVYEVA